jgi:tRNA-splicing endonuclease subunit Sen34
MEEKDDDLEAKARVEIHLEDENDKTNGQALLWTAREYKIVRQNYRIIGSLLGSLPGYRQQDSTRGLPVLLSKEEVYVLKENEWARIRFKTKKRKRNSSENEEAEEQQLLLQPRAATTRNQLRAMKASKKSQWGGAAKKKQKVVPKKKNDKEEETKKKSSNNRDRIVDWEQVLGRSSSVVLPLTTGELDDAPPEEEEEEAYERRVWRKMSKIDRYKCAVFKDLHKKGFTMTSAAKFGGDYLAYPGDPMLFHAYFTVRVLERGEKMTPLSCSSVTRMAHAARKNVVFAFCGEEDDDDDEKDEKGGDNEKNNKNDGVLRIQYFTCVPDIELSSNRGF